MSTQFQVRFGLSSGPSVSDYTARGMQLDSVWGSRAEAEHRVETFDTPEVKAARILRLNKEFPGDLVFNQTPAIVVEVDGATFMPCATCGSPTRPQWIELKSYDSNTRVRESDEWIAFYLCQNDHLTGRDGAVYTGPTRH